MEDSHGIQDDPVFKHQCFDQEEAAPYVRVDSQGIHTSRYNSLIKIEDLTVSMELQPDRQSSHYRTFLDSSSVCVFSKGNKVMVRDMQKQKTIVEAKIMEDCIMSIQQQRSYFVNSSLFEIQSSFNMIPTCKLLLSSHNQLKGKDLETTRLFMNRFIACSYDGELVVFCIQQDVHKNWAITIEYRLTEFKNAHRCLFYISLSTAVIEVQSKQTPVDTITFISDVPREEDEEEQLKNRLMVVQSYHPKGSANRITSTKFSKVGSFGYFDIRADNMLDESAQVMSIVLKSQRKVDGGKLFTRYSRTSLRLPKNLQEVSDQALAEAQVIAESDSLLQIVNYVQSLQTGHVVMEVSPRKYVIEAGDGSNQVRTIDFSQGFGTSSYLGLPSFVGTKFYAVIARNLVACIDLVKLFESDEAAFSVNGGQLNMSQAGLVYESKPLSLWKQSAPLQVRETNFWQISDCLNYAQVCTHDGNFFSLKGLHLKGKPSMAPEQVQEHLFELTCCGASLSPDFEFTMVGDMTGNVRLFRNVLDSYGAIKSKSLTSFFVEGGSIRYIHFHDFVPNFAIVATMGGQLFGITWDDAGSEIANTGTEMLASTSKTITNIRTARCKEPRDEYYIIFSDTGGFIYVLRGKDKQLQTYKSGGLCEGTYNQPAVLTLQAHPPSDGPFDKNFGSLQKYSEVWSTCTNPMEFTRCYLQYIVTSSEDQSVKIYKFNQWQGCREAQVELKETLKGHKLAVTSIDWKGNTLITCSDDKTIRVYFVDFLHDCGEITKLNGITLSCILDTKIIDEWHTLTYVNLSKLMNDNHMYKSNHGRLYKITCVAENGYLFSWNLSSHHNNLVDPGRAIQDGYVEMKYAQKIHVGSIEALAVRHKYFPKDGKEMVVGVCCSSDCSFSMLTFVTNQKNRSIKWPSQPMSQM